MKQINSEKPLKTYNYKMMTVKAVDKYEQFHCLSVYLNMTMHEAMSKLIDSFVTDYYPAGVTLVTETEALIKLKELGASDNRSKLAGWRRKGVLKDENGPFWWSNSDGAVVYDWHKLATFVQQRLQNPYRRLGEEETKIDEIAKIAIELKDEPELKKNLTNDIEQVDEKKLLELIN